MRSSLYLTTPSSPYVRLFGSDYTEKLKSRMFLAYHRAIHGKFSQGCLPRNRTCQLLCRSLTGETRTFAVDKESTVGDLQELVCALFDKTYPGTSVSFVVGEVVFQDFCALPLRKLNVHSEARVLFAEKVMVSITNLDGYTVDISVNSDASLRELQAIVCKLFRQSFPSKKAALIVAGRVYCDFIDVPFKHCSGSLEATVIFSPTDDPYFYDLRDRRPGMKSPSANTPEPLRL